MKDFESCFPNHRPNPNAPIQLVCFPYAGGNASVFREWQRALPDTELVAFEPAGRGRRFLEPPLRSMEAIASAASEALHRVIDRPFAIFGHSLGAIVGWEVGRQLSDAGVRPPLHLFVSGAAAPDDTARDRAIHSLPQTELIAELRKLNGTPPEILAHREMLELVLPSIRADFEASERYKYREGKPLSCPVTAFAGLEDTHISRKQVEGWRNHCDGHFSLHTIPGDHFFIHTAADAVTHVIQSTLRATQFATR